MSDAGRILARAVLFSPCFEPAVNGRLGCAVSIQGRSVPGDSPPRSSWTPDFAARIQAGCSPTRSASPAAAAHPLLLQRRRTGSRLPPNDSRPMRPVLRLPLLALVIATLVATRIDREPSSESHADRRAARPERSEGTLPEAVSVPHPSARTAAAPASRQEIDRTRSPGDPRSPGILARVRVTGEGAPLAGARCVLHALADDALVAAHAARTDASGLAEIAVPERHLPQLLRVECAGWSSFERACPAEHPPDWDVELVRGGTVAVAVRDDQGRSRPLHAVRAVYAGGVLAGQEASALDAARRGFATTVRALTGAEGRVALGGLLPGRWEVDCPPWKDCAVAEPVSIHVFAQGDAAVTVEVEAVPPSVRALGSIVGPELEPALDGIVERLSIEVRGANGRLPVYGDGSFVAFGTAGEVLEVRAVLEDAEGGEPRRSAWWRVRVGETTAAVRPEW